MHHYHMFTNNSVNIPRTDVRSVGSSAFERIPQEAVPGWVQKGPMIGSIGPSRVGTTSQDQSMDSSRYDRHPMGQVEAPLACAMAWRHHAMLVARGSSPAGRPGEDVRDLFELTTSNMPRGRDRWPVTGNVVHGQSEYKLVIGRELRSQGYACSLLKGEPRSYLECSNMF